MPSTAFAEVTPAASLSRLQQNNDVSIEQSHIIQSMLVQLPLELRQQIYTYVFSDTGASFDVTVRISNRKNAPNLQSSAFPTLRSLLLTNRQISTEVRKYFFAFHRFRFVDCDQGYLGLIATFWQEIGSLNVPLIRKISLPLYSIGLFGNVDCLMGQSRLWCASSMIARFPGLTHLDIGVDLVECLPPSHGLFHLESAEAATAGGKEELERWDWSGQESRFPMRDCFHEFGRYMGKKVAVGIYWSDLLTRELLPDHNRQLFATLKATYEVRFLVVLQQWLKVKSVKSKGPLWGFQRVYNEKFGGYILSDDGDAV